MKRFLSVLLAFALFISSAAFVSSSDQPQEQENLFSAEHTSDEVLVVIKEEYSGYDREYSVEDFPGVDLAQIEYLTFLFDDPADYPVLNVEHYKQILLLRLTRGGDDYLRRAIDALKANELVESAELNYVFECENNGGNTRDFVPNDTYYINQDFISDEINLKQAWDYSRGGDHIKIGIVGCGIGPHTEYNEFLESEIDLTNGAGVTDPNAEGIHIAGIIGAKGHNNTGVCGVCHRIKMVPIKVMVGNTFTTANLTSAVSHAITDYIPILFFTVIAKEHKNTLVTAINSYTGLVVCTAGDDGVNIDASSTHYCPLEHAFLPTQADNVLGVAAWDYDNDTRLTGSNYGQSSVDIYAPGDNIYTTHTNNNYYWIADKPVYAAAYVAGVAGLIKAYDPSLTNVQIKSAICNSKMYLNGTPTSDVSTGGWLDAGAALAYAANISTVEKTYRGVVKLTGTHVGIREALVLAVPDSGHNIVRVTAGSAITNYGTVDTSVADVFEFTWNNTVIPSTYHGELCTFWTWSEYSKPAANCVEVDSDSSEFRDQYNNIMNYTPGVNCYMLGDGNSDGIVDNTDLNSLYNLIQNGLTPTETKRYAFDFNNDGVLNSDDYSVLSDYLSGNADCLVDVTSLS